MNYEKIVYLPSNGIEYDPIVYTKPLGLEFNLVLNDEKFSSSSLDFILSVIKKTIGKEPHDFYIHDIFYLWIYIYTDNMNTNKYSFNDLCRFCNKENSIELNLSELKINYLNPISDKLNLVHNLNENSYIKFRRRKAKDCLFFGIKELESRQNDKNELVLNYIYPQLTEIISEKKTIEKENWLDFINNQMNTKQINDLFSSLRKNSFGLENEVIFKCKHCQKENLTNNAFDDISYSVINFSKTNMKKFEDSLRELLYISRLPIMTFEEALNLPLSYNEYLANIIKEMDFSPIF